VALRESEVTDIIRKGLSIFVCAEASIMH